VKRFAFPLERVLKLKRQRERLAELRQQQARLALSAAEAAVAKVRHEIEQLAARLQRLHAAGADARTWITQYQQSAALADWLEQAEANRLEATRHLEAADRVRTQIAIEVEALVTLRRQQWQAYRADRDHERQQQADELGLRRWQHSSAAAVP
jgi:flagellar biosynthesis chaperone FliJ